MIIEKLIRHKVLAGMVAAGQDPKFREIQSNTEFLKLLELELQEKFEDIFKKNKFVTLLEASARFIDAFILYLSIKNITLKKLEGERRMIRDQGGLLENRMFLAEYNDSVRRRRKSRSTSESSL